MLKWFICLQHSIETTMVCMDVQASKTSEELSPMTQQREEIKLHGRLVRLGSSARTPYTCRLSTWSSPTALQGPSGPGVFILGQASHLDAFSGYPYPTSLTGDATGVTAGTRAVGPTRSSRTRVGLPQHSNAHDGYRPNCLTTF